MSTDFPREQLEKIDVVRERTGLSFQGARELLEDANWDVLEALAIHEQETKALNSEWEVKGTEVLEKVKGLLKQGNVTRIRVKSNGKTIMDLPVTVGVVGAVLAPKLAVLAAVACMLSKCTIEFERTPQAEVEETETVQEFIFED